MGCWLGIEKLKKFFKFILIPALPLSSNWSNSWPLTTESSDHNDVKALRLGHFLVSEPLTAYQNSDLKAKTDNQLSTDYLSIPHQKTERRIKKDELKIENLVLVEKKYLPPINWCTGRILHSKNYRNPSRQNKVRLVSVNTNNEILMNSNYPSIY